MCDLARMNRRHFVTAMGNPSGNRLISVKRYALTVPRLPRDETGDAPGWQRETREYGLYLKVE